MDQPVLNEDTRNHFKELCEWMLSKEYALLDFRKGDYFSPLLGEVVKYPSKEDVLSRPYFRSLPNYTNSFVNDLQNQSDISPQVINFLMNCLSYCEQETMVTKEVGEGDDINRYDINFSIDAINKELTCSQYVEFTQIMKDTKIITSAEDPDLESIVNEYKQQNIHIVTVPYSGSGDEGALDTPVDQDGNFIALTDEMEDWCYSQLGGWYGGWYINDGSAGYLRFHVEEGKCELTITQASAWDIKTVEFTVEF